MTMTQTPAIPATPRTGDTILHRPTGEKWVVAYVDEGRLAPCGWPFGEARVDDCDLLKVATDEEHAAWLERLAVMQDTDDPRRIKARAALEAYRAAQKGPAS